VVPARPIFFCAVIAALVVPRPARAGEPAPEIQQARSLSEQARREYELGHFADAARLYESAYKLKPLPALLFNVAQCRRQMGDARGAVVAYRSFLRGDPDHPSAPTARELLDQLEDALRKGAPAQPSAPAVTATALVVAASQPAVAAKPPPAPPQALAEIAPAAPLHKRWPALAAGGAAAALLAVAVAESIAASSATDQLAQMHQQGAVSPADDARLRADAESKHGRARVLYVVSAVAAAAGVGLYFAF
jgi:tetratricopeptide (TPR) repeat protein